MNDKIGNCNDFVDKNYENENGILLTLEETIELQKRENKPILVYENTDKKLIDYFVSIGGVISS